MSANLEDVFINQFKNCSDKIGDDCAYIDGFVYGSDAFNEGTHFLRKWMSLFEIGQKAMIVNLSDIIAMNAAPKYALISIGFPKSIGENGAKELANGLKFAANNYGCEIIGGDTVENDKIIISITCIGKTNNPLMRSGVQKNDYLAYTGELGSVKYDLEALLRNETILPNSKFITPILRQDFINQAAQHLNAAIDISDGLFNEMQKLSEASGVGFELLEEISDYVGCSGEEYEILFSFAPEKLETIKAIAKRTNTQITLVAKACANETFVNKCKKHHFKN